LQGKRGWAEKEKKETAQRNAEKSKTKAARMKRTSLMTRIGSKARDIEVSQARPSRKLLQNLETVKKLPRSKEKTNKWE